MRCERASCTKTTAWRSWRFQLAGNLRVGFNRKRCFFARVDRSDHSEAADHRGVPQTMAAVFATLDIGSEIVFRDRHVHLDGRAIFRCSNFDRRQVLNLDGKVDQIAVLPITVRLQFDYGLWLVRGLLNLRRRAIEIVADEFGTPVDDHLRRIDVVRSKGAGVIVLARAELRG